MPGAVADALPEQPASVATRETLFAIVGNPNCGKSTIFNALTGLKQKVANYPGVTVEKREGSCMSLHGKRMKLIDLPGAYSLNARSPDEAVVRDVLFGRRRDVPRPDAVVIVVDASNLERNLYLATQVLELGLPTIVVLNMMDVAEAKQWRIDLAQLSQHLGVPIIPMQASIGKGLVELKAAMSRKLEAPPKHEAPMPADITRALIEVRGDLVNAGALHNEASLLEPLYLISDHDPEHYGIKDEHVNRIAAAHDALEKKFPGWEDTLAGARYEAIEKLLGGVLRRPEREESTFTDKLDRVLLHPVWGILSLAGMMFVMFYAVFSLSEGATTWIEDTFGALGSWVESTMPAGDLRDLIVQGVIAGVQGVVVFLPQILILFLFLGLMEDTGYMARVAFILDRLMGVVGLSGKSFIPFLSSFGCAVPGIMATRTIPGLKDRIVTILVAPLASCSARIPVYTLMIAAMLPSDRASTMTKALIMLSMYALGTSGAFALAWLFKRTLMKGQSSLMVLEMPSYKRPAFKHVLLFILERARIFVRRAGTVILGLSILLWAAMTYPKTNTEDKSVQLANSFAGQAGHFVEPVIKPLGFDWQIGIGLIASFAAREVFNSTMGIVYAVQAEDDEENIQLREHMAAEKWPDGSPVFTPLVCVSIMVFFVFAMQCLSTVAVVKRETNGWKWPLFQIGYMTAAAWLASFVVYQGGRLLGF
ncbi:ferrous iron transport protein B [Roseimicrobium sp. ORNL1]|uniref:ferrous iron transport protein B n=1 Tax=Roseimicrobium sp. ORNL1 TaxID=2711231 RepID=UPI0013E1F75A|nr:ferrous iron transport protein B [Roseimicrobium sp. ORNL1]QIF00291.1 ferrous iron transport protein B [Roseimicrobium sp. ORNL1]